VEVREIEVDGLPVRYRVAGTGSALVLVHGLSGSWRWWTPLVARLGGRRRLHLVELPRLGRRLGAGSLAPWLGRWLDAVGLGRVDLFGHSLGGLVAAEVAARRQEQVRRLVLAAPAGIPCGRGVLGRTLPLVEALFDVRGRLPTIVADAVRTGPISLAHGLAYVLERDLRAELADIRVPTLLIWGERDRLVPVSIAAEWERLLSDSRLVRLSCGHVPMWEAPRELSGAVVAFLEEQLADDTGDELRLRVVDCMGLARDDYQAAAGQ
jgi:pimeloyl-ACP methyl ester carboxylesterase